MHCNRVSVCGKFAVQSMQTHSFENLWLPMSNAALTCKQVLLLLATHLRSAPDSLCLLLVVLLLLLLLTQRQPTKLLLVTEAQVLLLLTQHQPTKLLLVPEAQVLMMLSQPATQRCP